MTYQELRLLKKSNWRGKLSLIKAVNINLNPQREDYHYYQDNYIYIETSLGSAFFKLNCGSFLKRNILSDDIISLDNTYIECLAYPTQEELDYLELTVGKGIVEIYKKVLEMLHEDLKVKS